MKPKEYQEAALRTLSPEWNMPTNGIFITHAIMGLVTESGELLEGIWDPQGYMDKTNIQEELGDLLWYVALLANILDIHFEAILNSSFEESQIAGFEMSQMLSIRLTIISADMLDQMKKILFYKKPLDGDWLVDGLRKILTIIYQFCDVFEIQLEEVGRINITKLKKRYPEKFTEEKAAQRDLAAERKTLEEAEAEAEVEVEVEVEVDDPTHPFDSEGNVTSDVGHRDHEIEAMEEEEHNEAWPGVS